MITNRKLLAGMVVITNGIVTKNLIGKSKKNLNMIYRGTHNKLGLIMIMLVVGDIFTNGPNRRYGSGSLIVYRPCACVRQGR